MIATFSTARLPVVFWLTLVGMPYNVLMRDIVAGKIFLLPGEIVMRALALLCLCILSVVPAQAFDACKDAAHYTPVAQRYTRGLLFKLEKCGEPASYIFGTVHLARDDVARAAAPAFLLMPDVQAAGFEIDLPENKVREIARNYMRSPSQSTFRLQEALSEQEYGKLKEILNMSGVDIRTCEHMRPWVVAVLLEFVGEKPGTPLDDRLKRVAERLGKSVFGLETPEEQFDIFANLPEATQLRLLKESINQHGQIMKQKQETLDAYLQKDLNTISTLGQESLPGGDQELDQLLDEQLLTSRNEVMEKRLLPKLAGRSVLVSVGAMHLLGKDGLLSLLEKDGYFVTPMP